MRLVRLTFLAGLAALVVAPSALALRFSDASLLPPSGVTGQAYFHKLDGAGGCNENDYEFRVIGGTSVPPGLALRGSGTDWRIEGTPTQAGDFDVWLQLWSDVGGTDCELLYGLPPKTAERMITIRIAQGLAISDAGIPTATVGTPYSHQFTAAGGGTQRWSASGLPAGLTMSSSGLLSGTPQAKNPDLVIAVRVEDGGRSSVRSYRLAIRDALRLTVPSLPPAEVGRPLSIPFQAAGGNEQWTWEVAPVELPAGLTLLGSGATRVLAGKPEIAGTFALKVTVKDTEGRVASADVPLRIAPRLSIAAPRLRTAKSGKRVTIVFRTRGGVTADGVEWRLLRFRPFTRVIWNKTTGRLSFVPHPKRKRYTIVVRATDGLKARSTHTLTVVVRP